VRIEYGLVRAEIERWQWPTLAIFEAWKGDFLDLEESLYFDIYLLGGFLEKLNGKKDATSDVDIILTGCDDMDRIETLIVAGTRLGLEKYGVFFDVLWFDRLPVYADDPQTRHVTTCIASNQWIVDGEVRKTYPDASPLRNSLWRMDRRFPTRKQRELLDQGYSYCRPLRIAARVR